MTTWEDTLIRLQNATIGGFAQAAAFTWWDRAVYLSVKEGRPFLHRENFRHPYQGFLRAAMYRTFSAGLYWFLQDEFYELLGPQLEGVKRDKMIVGICTGTVNGMILNQFATIRYYMWGQDEKSFWSTARHMWKDGGFRPFFRGLVSTTTRDALYGAVYEETRWRLYRYSSRSHKSSSSQHPSSHTTTDLHKFVGDFVASAFAYTVATPFNYIRNLKYATQAGKPTPSGGTCLYELWKTTLDQRTLGAKIEHVNERLVIGWGIARVGLGVAFTQFVFDKLQSRTRSKKEAASKNRK